MKTLVKLVVLLISTSVFAQNSIEREIGEFTVLKVYDLIHVELIKSDKNKVIITGKNTEDVILKNTNGVLKIKMNIGEIFDGDKTHVKLYYTSVDIIDVNEGAIVKSEDTIEQFEIDLKAQEGASISVPVAVKYANIKSVTGGIINATGQAKTQNVTISTGGVYKGSKVDTENTDISIKAGGEGHVRASKVLDIKIRAGGDVYIYGQPETINESKALGGRVKRVDS